MNSRIVAMNLPAGLEREIVGNPVASRPEDAPANCYPGLEADLRNLDRRFFPGLVFNFVTLSGSGPALQQRGVRLVAVDAGDPDLVVDSEAPQYIQTVETAKLAALNRQLAALSDRLAAGPVFLDAIYPGRNGAFCFSEPQLSFLDSDGTPFDWDISWRLVRSLPPGPLKISLSSLISGKRAHLMDVVWKRRIFQTKSGNWSDAFKPGELSQSLCSPWQHDFRDCGCTYWASSHPDIVMAAHPADIAEVDDPGADADRAEEPILWLRHERDRDVAPRATVEGCRPLELDHYEINQRWRELAIVLEGREQPAPWAAVPTPEPPCFAGGEDALIERLVILAGVEQALALEYLYARYTVAFHDPLPAALRPYAEFIAHELLNIAIGEMTHLRWVNELIFGLQERRGKPHSPALRVAKYVPRGIPRPDEGRAPRFCVEPRKAEERPLGRAIEDFLNAEAPSGTLEGQYARILSFLSHGGYSPDLIGLVSRIIADGVGHYSRFREIKALLQRPDGGLLVKKLDDVEPSKNGRGPFEHAEELYRALIGGLESAYETMGSAAIPYIGAAGAKMKELDEFARDLGKQGKGIPILQIGFKVAGTLPEDETIAALTRPGPAAVSL